jgi:hypothetical protein
MAMHWPGLFVTVSCLLASYRGPAQGTVGADLYTTNQNLTHAFWNAVERSNGPVTVLAFGDSVSDSYRSIQTFVFQRLQAQLGWAGDTLGNFQNTTLWQLGNGTAVNGPSTNWWGIQGAIPPGGFLFWTNQGSVVGSLVCDQLGVFWIAQPNGGAFSLSVSTNGGPWTPVLALDGYSLVPAGRYASASLERRPYRLRVDGLSGTNLILGPRYLDSTSSGIDVAFMTQDGANLNQIFSLSTNLLYPILAALNPQLVVWHMKELGDIGEIGLSNRLYDLEALWKACVTNGDIVYIGTPYDIDDLTQEFTPIQNQLVRQAALRDHRVYMDCMTPCVSYQSMTNNGYLDDAVHPSNLCDSFLASIAWEELGLFALRVDRHISMESSGTVVHLRWPTAPNLTYDLESSSNLQNWSVLGSFVGNGQFQTYSNLLSAGSNVFFRIQLRDK